MRHDRRLTEDVEDKYQHRYLDALFIVVSCVVSVPFYTGFLPLLFWSGHCKLARLMTLLLTFCDFVGNSIKFSADDISQDVVSAPRPSSPPVKRITFTEDEIANAMEYGLPSSHTLNTVCLSGFLMHYVLSYNQINNPTSKLIGIAIVCISVGLVGFARISLGMHSLIDIIGGLVLGLAILSFWLSVHTHIDTFIVSGQNVSTFWALLSFLLLFTYPTPELPTPSFEYSTSFNGVALGIVTGVQQTYSQFHHENVARIFTPQLRLPLFIGRMLVGIPTILLVKFCSKGVAKWTLPIIANALGIPVKSKSYIPSLNALETGRKPGEAKQSGYLHKMLFFTSQDSFNVDTGIRLIQYAGLAWSVVDLVPSIFSYLSL
ncbi:phosphatase [Lithospermum erythrorhizon]|uniref:Phosphatase n=1 Tax=Lithospermum erythrorhizon TaxID=34254 RepID=A0AAV3PU01_LITER